MPPVLCARAFLPLIAALCLVAPAARCHFYHKSTTLENEVRRLRDHLQKVEGDAIMSEGDLKQLKDQTERLNARLTNLESRQNQAGPSTCFSVPPELPPYRGEYAPSRPLDAAHTVSDASITATGHARGSNNTLHATRDRGNASSRPLDAAYAASDASTAASVDTNLDDTLHAAAKRGDDEAVRRFLVVGADPNARDAQGDTALHAAARAGHVEPMDALLWFGADPRTRGHLLRSPLHVAAVHGHLRAAQRLLKAGARPGDRDANGDAPLALAAAANHSELFQLLLQHDASARYVDAAGDSPLLSAARAQRWELALNLTRRGASPAARGRDGATALQLAAAAGRAQLVQAMLRYGAVCDAEALRAALEEAGDGGVVWALAQAAPELLAGAAGRGAVRRAVRDCRLDALAALLAARGESASGRAALLAAAETGRVRCVVALLERSDRGAGDAEQIKRMLGPEVDADTIRSFVASHPDVFPEAFGREVLKNAVRSGCCDCIEPLLAAVADLMDRNGSVLLSLVEQKRDADCIERLFGNKTYSEKEEQVIGAVRATQSEDVARVLGEVAPDVFRGRTAGNSLVEAAGSGRSRELAVWLAAGVDPDRKADNGDTALVAAAEKGRVECVQRLLRACADKEATVMRGHGGWTALHRAASEGHLDAVRALLTAGASTKAETDKGDTPLIEASYYGHEEIVRALLEAGADVNARDKSLWTALHKAAHRERTDIVKLLLQKGARKDFRDKNGHTAMDFASHRLRRLMQ